MSLLFNRILFFTVSFHLFLIIFGKWVVIREVGTLGNILVTKFSLKLKLIFLLISSLFFSGHTFRLTVPFPVLRLILYFLSTHLLFSLLLSLGNETKDGREWMSQQRNRIMIEKEKLQLQRRRLRRRTPRRRWKKCNPVRKKKTQL